MSKNNLQVYSNNQHMSVSKDVYGRSDGQTHPSHHENILPAKVLGNLHQQLSRQILQDGFVVA
jgi:hypothetical protein